MRAPAIVVAIFAIFAIAASPFPQETTAPSAPADPGATLPRLEVDTPLDGTDVDHLAEFWKQHELELGVRANVTRVVERSSLDLRPNVLLLGYERGFLDSMAADERKLDVFAPSGEGETVRSFARESWTPAWKNGARAEQTEIEGFASLLSDSWRGHVLVRRVTFDSSEGLVLAEVARRLKLDGEEALPQFVLGSDAEGTIVSPTLSSDRLLEMLPAGAATIVPVRAAARARRGGTPLTFPLPREGFLALELAAAITKGSSHEAVDWFASRFAQAVAPKLCHELELEPIAEPPADAPEWMRFVARSATPVDHAAAERVRLRLARLYDAPLGVAATPYDGSIPVWIDGLLLTIAVVVALVAWRKVGRDRARDRRGGRLV